MSCRVPWCKIFHGTVLSSRWGMGRPNQIQIEFQGAHAEWDVVGRDAQGTFS